MHASRRQVLYTAWQSTWVCIMLNSLSVVCRLIAVAVPSTVPLWGMQRSKSLKLGSVAAADQVMSLLQVGNVLQSRKQF